MVKLGDVLEERSTKTESFDSASIQQVTVKLHGLGAVERKVDLAKARPTTSGYRIVAGDFIYSRIDARNGAFAIVPPFLDGAVVSKDFPTFALRTELISPRFLECLCKSDFITKQAKAKSFGATNRQRIPTDLLMSCKIPLPPLEEQQRIAKILGTVEKAIHFSLEALSARQLLRKSVIEKVLEQNSEAPSLALSQIAEISSGITKGRKVRPDALLTETPYLAVSNVKDGYLDLGTVSTIAITENEKSRFALHNGDILLTEGGDPDKLGRGVVWRGEIEGAIHQNHIFRCRLNEETNYNPEALMAVISSQRSKQYFLQCAKQTTGIATINKTQLSKLKVPDLDSGVLNRMQEMLHKVDNEILLSHRKIELLRELYASLSSRAFAGEL
ncbi:restriction endonuclease subunit S [Corynebacterium sp. UMB8791]